MRRTAERLDRGLTGQRLTGSDLRVPQLATIDLAGAVVHRTATHGKHLLTRMTTDGGERLTLHTHLRMDGSWRILRPAARWPAPAPDVRVALRSARADAIGILLGVVDLLPTADEGSVIGHLGPDLLGPWTGDQAQAAVDALTQDGSRVLGEALLDQRVVAGIGTIWLAETCFVQGVHPLSPAAALGSPLRLLTRARSMMQAAVRHGRPVTTGDRRSPLWVYGRQGKPCLRCGTTLRSGQIGQAPRERTTVWCPHCQPGP